MIAKIYAVNWKNVYRLVIKTTWALLFFTLPITSFPYFPSGFGGKTLVRPLAIFPLILLVMLITIPRLLKSSLPRSFLPLIAFIILATISSIFAFTADKDALREVTMFSRFVRNMVTLGIGAAFYLTVSLLHNNWDDLKYSLRWLYIA